MKKFLQIMRIVNNKYLKTLTVINIKYKIVCEMFVYKHRQTIEYVKN